MTNESLEAAYRKRRSILGDAYVDRQRAASGSGSTDFQDYVTSVAWTVWNRDGLSDRDRSLLVLAMTAALGRMEEFKLHASCTEQTKVTDVEIDELIFQVTAYCGAPAGTSANRAWRQVRAEREVGS